MDTRLSMYEASIHHDGSELYVLTPGDGAIFVGDRVTLRVRTGPDAPVERVLLRTAPDGEGEFRTLQAVETTPAARWWSADITILNRVTHYRFLIITADGMRWLNASGLHRHNPTDAEDFKLVAGWDIPEWLESAVFYQIFPDRFCDGDPANNVRDGEYEYRGVRSRAGNWGEVARTVKMEDQLTYYGGDLAGIAQKLDYIEDLGASALYLNPIFSAYSNHRYDVTDYFQVDPHLGGNQALVHLREATFRRGMRLILDIVPNHCGVAHPWFQAALNNPEAETADFFTINHETGEYESWLGVPTLPKLNYRSRRLREVMYQGENAAFRYWLKPPYSIDGWRIDVANMLARQGEVDLNLEVGSGIRQAVKGTRPDAYLLGENFFDASSQLQGDFLDGAMNYSGFTIPLWRWLSPDRVWAKGGSREPVTVGPISTKEFVRTLDAFRATIPWQAARMQFNLLGSHDTARIWTRLGGNRDHLRLAIGLLFTYPGVPSVYYGDEIGMQGDEHHNRGTMVWDPARWDSSLREFYRRMIALRKSAPALCRGGFQWLLAEGDVAAYLRESREDALIVVASRGAEVSSLQLPAAVGGIADGTRWVDVLTGEEVTVQAGGLPLKRVPAGVMIWRRQQ